METARARMEAGEKRISASQKRVGESTRAMGREAARSADLYQDAAGRWRNASGQFASDAEKAAVGVESANRRVQTSARQTSSAVESMAKKSGDSYARIGRAAKVGAGAGLRAFAAVIGKSLMAAGDFEQTLNVLQATSGATNAQMKRISQTATELGNDLSLPGTSAKDAADAMLELNKAGLSVTDTMGAAKGVLQLSAAAQISNADAAVLVGDSLNAFKLKGVEAVRVADLLAAAANAASGSIPEMGAALQQSAASAHQLGVPIEDLVTMIGEMANNGIKGSDAGTSLKTMMAALTPNTAKAKDAVKALGVETFDADGKFVGIKDTIKQYKEGLSKLTDEQKAQTIETIFGSDASRAAAIIMDQGVGAFERMKKKTTEVGAAGDLAKAQMKGLKGAVEGLKSGAETAALTLGQSLLPLFTEGAQKASEFFASLDASDVRDIGGHISDGLREFAQVGGDVVHVGGQVAGVLIDIGDALNLGDAGNLEAIVAGIAGFKVAGLVAPMVAQLATNLSLVVANARTAPTALAFLRSLPVSPLTAVAGAAAILAGGLVLLGTRESGEAAIARDSADAHKAQAEAMKAVHDAEMAAADKGLAAKQSTLDLKQAEQDLVIARKEHGKNSKEVVQAELNVEKATLRSTAAHKDYTKSIKDQDAAAKGAIEGIKGQTKGTRAELEDALERVNKLKDAVKQQESVEVSGGVHSQADPQTLKELAAAQKALVDRNAEYIQSVAQANVTDTNRHRLMQQSTQITDANTQSVAELINHLDGVPLQKQTKLLLDDQDALADAGTLASKLDAIGKGKTVAKVLTTAPSAAAAVLGLQAVLHGVPVSTVTKINQNAPSAGAAVTAFKAILAGVPASKAIKILQNADSAAAAVHGLQGAIDSLHGKTVTITTVEQRIGRSVTPSGKVLPKATGRGPGASEAALVGENPRDPVEWIVNPQTGTAMRVDSPRITNLGADDYVIPRDPRFRGRAVGWLAEIAADLGVQAFAGGKKGKTKKASKARYVPSADLVTAYNVDEFEKRKKTTDDAITKAKTLHKSVDDAERQLRRAERMPAKTGKQKSARRDSIDAAQERLRGNKKKGTAGLLGQLHALPERGDLTKLREDLSKRKAELKAANAYQTKIDRADKRVNNAATAMGLADKRDDDKAYAKARGEREVALNDLRKLVADALGFSQKAGNVDRGLDLQGQLDQIDSDLVDVRAATMDVEDTPEQQAAEREADTGMTDAERARLQEIDKNIALAGLTTTLDDDKKYAGEKVDFLQQILDMALVDPARGGAAAITDLANSLRDAKENLASFTGNGTNSDSDLQAQLDQANERTRVSAAESATNAAALQAFQGFAGAGAGGLGGGTTVNITQSNLHPGDPKVWAALAQTTAQGLDLARTRRGTSIRVGP